MKSRAPGKSLVLFAPVLLAGCLGMPEGVRPVDGFEPARIDAGFRYRQPGLRRSGLIQGPRFSMPNTIKCDVVSSRRQLFSGEVTRCIVSGVGGDLGIYPRHAPLMTILKPGQVRVQPPGEEELIFIIGGGILEVMPHMVTVLADHGVRAQDVDEAAAQRAKREAERELATRTTRMELAQAEAKLLEALAQLRAVELLRRRPKQR